ncbi:unnamed protein product [Allacma fusca]|uniref:BED-type domain-containing protein n=1 Tax=Allacma fusca TaxID=39272 RepID=A0A8J2LDC9_9HEXA|nr:unnamed protein product [Allacma fusca]
MADQVLIRAEDYQIPVKAIREAFQYIGHKYDTITGIPKMNEPTSIQAKCLICDKIYPYQSPSCGGVSNLMRHLKKYHPGKSEELQIKQAASKEKSKALLQSWVNSKEVKYQPTDVQQSRFNKSLMYCIAKDKLPMSLGNSKGFQNVRTTLDPKIVIPSRSTIQRRFKKEHENSVVPNLKRILKSVDKGIVYLDGWKSRRKDGILAFKFHFIDECWNLRCLTIGIREINVSQTGEAIRKYFDALMTELNLGEKVALVMTDSGSNMIKAFKAPTRNNQVDDADDETDSDEDVVIEDAEMLSDEITLYCDSDSDDEYNDVEGEIE